MGVLITDTKVASIMPAHRYAGRLEAKNVLAHPRRFQQISRPESVQRFLISHFPAYLGGTTVEPKIRAYYNPIKTVPIRSSTLCYWGKGHLKNGLILPARHRVSIRICIRVSRSPPASISMHCRKLSEAMRARTWTKSHNG
jgi:hypothetical protein